MSFSWNYRVIAALARHMRLFLNLEYDCLDNPMDSVPDSGNCQKIEPGQGSPAIPCSGQCNSPQPAGCHLWTYLVLRVNKSLQQYMCHISDRKQEGELYDWYGDQDLV